MKPTGIGIRGNFNVVRYNLVLNAVGSGVRLGGTAVDGIQYGINNEVIPLFYIYDYYYYYYYNISFLCYFSVSQVRFLL